jgi:hypothetical protein
MHDRDFSVKPRTARADFAGFRLCVNPPLPSRLPLEMFYDIGHVRTVAFDARLRECLVQNPACGPDKGVSREIFIVAGLLAHEHDIGLGFPFSKHRLRRIPPQMARAAAARSALQRAKGSSIGQCGS